MIEVDYLEDMPLCVSPENPFETGTYKFELRTDKKMLIDPSKVMFASTFRGLVREHSDEDSPKNEFKEVDILELVYGESLYVRTIYKDELKGILVKPYFHPELVMAAEPENAYHTGDIVEYVFKDGRLEKFERPSEERTEQCQKK